MTKINWINDFRGKWIYTLGYFYLFTSVAIFLIGNVKLWISIPLTIAIFIGVLKGIKNAPIMEVQLFHGNKKFWIILLIIILWVAFSGIGGFIWQNRYDHMFRNALFMDLVNFDWPVIQDGNALCYYLGYWLPAALFGKLFGLEAGYMFQLLWAIIGVTIAFGLICQFLKKVKISNIFIFIFFSGIDIVLYLIFSGKPLGQAWMSAFQGAHIELVAEFFNSSSNTTLLFWVYNQIIPFWVGMMLLLQQKNSKSVGLIFALMLLFCPFPLVALVPVALYMIFKKHDGITEKNMFKNLLLKIKYACSFENIVSVLLVIIIALYMKSNISAGKVGLLELNSNVIIKFICHIFFEYIVYLIFIYKRHRKDPILNILLVVSLFLPFITMGHSTDFAQRTCIPLGFYIMLLVMQDLQDKTVSDKIKIGLVLVLCLGAITPITEMIRTATNEPMVLQGYIRARSDFLPSVFKKEFNEHYENFIGNTDSIFYKYLAK